MTPSAWKRRLPAVRFRIIVAPIMKHGVSVLVVLLALVAGCPPRQVRVPYDPIPMREAAAVVNGNISKIKGTLRAVGSVDGTYTLEDGRRSSYHVDATLFRLAPSYFRFDLKKFGERQFLLGSNDEHYWIFTRQDDSYFCGRQGAREELPPHMPARPDQMLDSLGLTSIPDGWATAGYGRLVQRVVDDYQQVLFLQYDEAGRRTLEKEYWLDRYPPQLIRRVIFRDAAGVETMRSELGDYKPLSPGGPLLPHVMKADWPRMGATLRFHARRWTLETQIGPDSIQFATPSRCADRPPSVP